MGEDKLVINEDDEDVIFIGVRLNKI